MHRRECCRLCDHKDFDLFISLEKSALANNFTDVPIKQETYPLDVFKCKNCGHFQLLDIIDPNILFKNYLYSSGTSQLMKDHFKKYCDDVCKKFKLNETSFVVDIGSNDSTLLKYFKEFGTNVLGVEPAVNLAIQSERDGIHTINDFFTQIIAQDIINKYGQADVICMNNAFAHIDNLKEIVLGVKKLLKYNGAFIFEVSYFKNVLQTNDFSQIYAEHLSYHTINPLKYFFEKLNMTLVNVEEIDIHGGSIRCTVINAVKILSGIHFEENITCVDCFPQHIEDNKSFLQQKLQQYKKQGKKIAAATASAKSTTILHHYELDNNIINYICDDAKDKVGKFSPGKNIPVVPFSKLYKDNPDYVIILSYNFCEFIMNKHKNFKGTWITLFPEYKEYK